MRLSLTLAALAAATTLCATAQAGNLASPPIYGGFPGIGGTFSCRIFNAGAASVTISARQIFVNPGTAIALTSDTCSAPLAAGKYCAFTSGVGNFAYICQATTVGSAASLRGLGEVQTSAHAFITSEPMR
jgi:hypothetical protein